MIIALTGKKGSGKSTAADYIADRYGFRKYAFADPIKQACKLIFGWTDEQVNDPVLKEALDPFWGLIPREGMQSLGYDWGQRALCEYDKFREVTWRTLWAKRFVEMVYTHTYDWVISDMRFRHEWECLRMIGCPVVSIKVIRPGHRSDDTHASETELNWISPIDHMLINTGSIPDFQSDLDTIMGHIAGGSR